MGVDNILAADLALPPETRSLHIFHGVGHSPNVAVPEAMAGLLARFWGKSMRGARITATDLEPR